MKNYYQVLEIEPTATPEQIKSQYRLLALAWHPDKFPSEALKGKAQEHLVEINQAYNILGDQEKRQYYDLSWIIQPDRLAAQETVSRNEVSEGELDLVWDRWAKYETPGGVTKKILKIADPLNRKILDLVSMLSKVDQEAASDDHGQFEEMAYGLYLLCYYIGYDLAAGKIDRSAVSEYLEAATSSIDRFVLKIFALLIPHGVFGQEKITETAKEIASLTGKVSNNLCILGTKNYQKIERQLRADQKGQLTQKPSRWWKFSPVSGFLLIGAVVVVLAIWMVSVTYSSDAPQSPQTPVAAKVLRRTMPTVRITSSPPTKTSLPTPVIEASSAPTGLPPITYHGAPCSPWDSINSSHIGSKLCIYGKIFAYGPFPDGWTTISFTPDQTAFRVVDFNNTYSAPLQLGDCAIIYGTIRDNSSYLVIAPDFRLEDSIQTRPPQVCGAVSY